MNRAKPFGFDISFFDPYLPSGAEKAHGVGRHWSLDDLLAESDIISFHCKLTDETHHMLNAESIAKCKPGVRIVNVSRGGLIDEAALVSALKDGRVGCAALDVHEVEPYLPSESAFSSCPNVYCLPHVAWYSDQSFDEIWETACEEVVRVVAPKASPKDLHNCVNARNLVQNDSRWQWSDTFLGCDVFFHWLICPSLLASRWCLPTMPVLAMCMHAH